MWQKIDIQIRKMKQLIDDLNWRYATKKYDSSKKISQTDFETLKHVLSLVPTSNGLQPYQFLIIENPEIRAQLREKSYNQSQVTDASHLIVMCAFNSIDEAYVDNYMDRSVEVRGLNPTDVEGYRMHLKNSVAKADSELQLRSNAKQVYIALGQLLQTAAQLRIDASPMEGFSPEGYDEVLGLKAKNLTAVVVCALGYRSVEDDFQHLKKVRKPHSDLFQVID